ncbi:MAG: peptidoglycan-binding protein [Verrucomicrobia bacterium]|nr:peptidoglycan-binding protein [Verrucomicrobiota bacterium]
MSISFNLLRATPLLAFALLSLVPNNSLAKDSKGGKGHSNAKGNHGDKGRGESHGNPHHDHDQQSYHAHSSSNFKLNKGNGHAGQGYYYGPPNAPYYHARPGVSYYPNHGAIPQKFRNQDAYRMNSDDFRVQQALARLGYYQGTVDGRMGPQSMRAINNYQQAQGQQTTGIISAILLRSLGLQ